MALRIGVSGTSGFVGRALVSRLVAGGDHVVPIVRAAQGAGEQVVVGDLAAATVPGVPPELDAIVHLAGVAADVAGEEHLRAVNVDGTRAMLELAGRAGARRFVFLSSAKVNGERTAGLAFTAFDRPDPQDAYGHSKWDAEELVRAEASTRGIAFTIFRPPLVYGPGQKGNLAALAHAVRRGIPLPFAWVNNRRSLIHVANLADLIAVSLTHPGAMDQTFMAADDTNVSTGRLVHALGYSVRRQARLFPVPNLLLAALAGLVRRGSQAARLLQDLEIDDSATRAALGWVPPLTPDQALRTWIE